MPNSIDFYKGIFLHVIPVRISMVDRNEKEGGIMLLFREYLPVKVLPVDKVRELLC